MKRIDKPVASQIGATQAETAQVENTQAEAMQAAWTEAWGQQLNHFGEVYGRLFARMRDQFPAFVQKRLDANMEAARAWSACRSVNEALELQQSWLHSAIEHYSDQSVRMSELCRSAVFRAEAMAQQTFEDSKAALERKPAQETHAPHIQRAAE